MVRVQNARGEGDRLGEQLIVAATALLLEPGTPPSLSLRAVARMAGVAPSAVYLRFQSAAELLEAVLEAQYGELREALAIDIADPVDRVVAVARAYAAWGATHPGAYRLLFERPEIGTESHGPGADLLDRLGSLLVGTGVTPEGAPVAASRLWSAVHGITALRLHKPDGPWPSEIGDDVEAVARAIIDAERTR